MDHTLIEIRKRNKETKTTQAHNIYNNQTQILRETKSLFMSAVHIKCKRYGWEPYLVSFAHHILLQIFYSNTFCFRFLCSNSFVRVKKTWIKVSIHSFHQSIYGQFAWFEPFLFAFYLRCLFSDFIYFTSLQIF